MNCCPLPLPTLALPAALAFTAAHVLLPAEALLFVPGFAGLAVAGGGVAAPAPAPPAAEKPHPPLPATFPTAVPEQIPLAPLPPMIDAQQPELQSALLRHAPVMNCLPAPLPTFLAPLGSTWMGLAAAAPPVLGGGVVPLPALAAGGGGEEGGAAAAPPPAAEKPQPPLPATLPTAGPEQMPFALLPPTMDAQHPEAQSALLRHAPVMNWVPAPLPRFFAPLGSTSMG